MSYLPRSLEPSALAAWAPVPALGLGGAEDEEALDASLALGSGSASALPTAFAAPLYRAPSLGAAGFVGAHFDAGTYADTRDKGRSFAKGTTCLAFLYKGGVCVSVDSRASQGPYVGSQSVRKILEVNRYMLATMAGGAADCLFWVRNLTMQIRVWELKNGRRISVAAASKMFINILSQYRGMGLSIGSMVAGYDEKGPALYYIDDDCTRLKAKETSPYFAVGSGSTYAYGILDTHYRADMTDEQAVELGKRAIAHAVHRDGYSGGINNVCLVKPEGWTQVFSGDTTAVYREFYPQGHA